MFIVSRSIGSVVEDVDAPLERWGIVVVEWEEGNG